ncbi:hypothetical protein D3C73_1454340 [compost metagenome]
MAPSTLMAGNWAVWAIACGKADDRANATAKERERGTNGGYIARPLRRFRKMKGAMLSRIDSIYK